MLASVKRFNTAGPCNPAWHYMVPPEARLPEARQLAQQGSYFVLHAPRQTGKTTLISQLGRAMTAQGDFAALHFSCEPGKAFDDVGEALRGVLFSLRFSANLLLPPELRPPDPWPDAPDSGLIIGALSAWAAACPRPLVLFIDEIDALRGDALVSMLGQLRTGYEHRPGGFPHALALCGLRDVRDYKMMAGGNTSRLGSSSPFNIKIASLRLRTFARADVEALYRQHEQATGQAFSAAALDRAWALCDGQPWLANALAREVVEVMGVAAPTTIEAEHLDQAKDGLILARQTHLDSLVARLMEAPVRRVVGPLLAGGAPGGDFYEDDVSYLRDLGLVAAGKPVRIANPIYREIIVRVLSASAEDQVEVEPRAFVLEDGRLDLRRLLEDFARFWVEHGEIIAAGVPYHEVAPQLVMMAHLQRVVNGGGYIDREYGAGRGRIDLLVRWPWDDGAGRRQVQREALELKVWRDGEADPLARGLGQLDGYLERLGLDRGVLVVFDRRADAAPIAERTRFEAAETTGQRQVTVLRG